MPEFRAATFYDIAVILPMMEEFYRFERLTFDAERNEKLLSALVSDASLGRLVVIVNEGLIAGYLILGFGFSVEFGGRDALLDELFIVPEKRGAGLGTAAIEYATSVCRDLGIKALHLEADHFNTSAHELYLRLGFKDHERHLMTRWL